MAILDTNVAGATAGEIVLTTESMVTLYVLPDTGDHDKHRVVLQISPTVSGANWRRFGQPVRGIGVGTYIAGALRARARVGKPEGSTSTVDVHLIAR